jgi:hypothetical protein
MTATLEADTRGATGQSPADTRLDQAWDRRIQMVARR